MTEHQPANTQPPRLPASPYPTAADDETRTSVPVAGAYPVFAAPEPYGATRPTSPQPAAVAPQWAAPAAQAAPTPPPQWAAPAAQPAWGWSAPEAPAQAPRPQRSSKGRTVTPGLLAIAVIGTALLTSGGTYLAVSGAQPRAIDAAGSGATGNVPPAQAPANGGGGAPATPAPQATQAPTTPNTVPPVAQGSIVDIVKAVSPAVVTIQAEGITSTDPTTGMTGQGTAVGSGVIFDANGLILTNHHVVAGDPSKLTVTLKDGRSFDATVYGVDSMTDLAIVKVEATGLPTAPIGSSASIQVGQQAIAIGSPLGQFTDSVTSGIVSALGRSIDTAEESLTNLIQTDTAINPGNSGGPLLDGSGKVIGINTAVASDSQGIGFAIPIDIASPLLAQASAGQPLARAWLGVRFETIDATVQEQASLPVAKGAWIPDTTAQAAPGAQDPNAQDPNAQGTDPFGGDPFGGEDPFGIFGQGQAPSGNGGTGSLTPQEVVVAGSPAEKAGLKAGDIITSVDGTALDATHTLDLALGQMTPGQTATFGILRDGQTITVTVTVGTRPTTA